MPHEFAARRKDKLRYRRAPGGAGWIAGAGGAPPFLPCAAAAAASASAAAAAAASASAACLCLYVLCCHCCCFNCFPSPLQVPQRGVLHGCHPAPGASGHRWAELAPAGSAMRWGWGLRDDLMVRLMVWGYGGSLPARPPACPPACLPSRPAVPVGWCACCACLRRGGA